jgi:hypothetical protein
MHINRPIIFQCCSTYERFSSVFEDFDLRADIRNFFLKIAYSSVHLRLSTSRSDQPGRRCGERVYNCRHIRARCKAEHCLVRAMICVCVCFVVIEILKIQLIERGDHFFLALLPWNEHDPFYCAHKRRIPFSDIRSHRLISAMRFSERVKICLESGIISIGRFVAFCITHDFQIVCVEDDFLNEWRQNIVFAFANLDLGVELGKTLHGSEEFVILPRSFPHYGLSIGNTGHARDDNHTT